MVSGESAGEDVGVTVEDVLEDTERYSRETVTVSGRIRELGRGAFAVGGEEPNDQLLLLTTAHTRGTASEGELLLIAGTVRRFERKLFRALRRPFVASLGARFLEPYEDRPALIVLSFSVPEDDN